MKTAIVSTFVNADNVIDSFIKYHSYIGYDYFIFFIDDNSPTIINHLESNYKDKVFIIKKDEEHKRLAKKTSVYKEYNQFSHNEVMARQIINVEIALNICLENNINWITHIDIDELFFLTKKKSIKELFLDFESLGYDNSFHYNYEALAQRFDIKDYFIEVNLFKKNPRLFTMKDINILGLQEANTFYLGYQNGKASTKVTPETKIESVHRFIGKKMVIDYENIILHYICCGYDNFVNKYKVRGDFPDKWFNKRDIKPNIPFHINSRDTIKTDDTEAIKKLYRENVIKYDEQQVNFLLNCELLKIIDKPKQIIMNLRT
ncbi:MAG: glycosyltransferase family 2 protein [Candidatus Sericytochromatia bacterium]